MARYTVADRQLAYRERMIKDAFRKLRAVMARFSDRPSTNKIVYMDLDEKWCLENARKMK